MKAIEKELSKTFTINVSELRHFTEEEIKDALKGNTKRELLEYLLRWKSLAETRKEEINNLKN